MEVSLLHLERVRKNFGTAPISILADISVMFKSGHTYAIEGISGTGKSTLMHIIAGLDMPSQGAVFFNNQNLAQMMPQERDYFLQHEVGLLFQQPYLIKELTILENVMLPGLIAGKDTVIVQQDAQLLIESVGLAHKMNAKPAMLSGGQQQRIALARALINKPSFLLADEPTGNLDEQSAQRIIQLMVKLQQIWNMGIIVTTHDHQVTQAMQARYALVNGQLHTVK